MHFADVLIAPYHNKVFDNGGNEITDTMSPLKIYDYMSSGTPMVVSRLPVLEEFLQDGHNCLLANPEDVVCWKRAIRHIELDPLLAKTIARQAITEVETVGNWDARADTILLDFYANN